MPTVILAELYRGGGRNQMVDALLAREEQALVLRERIASSPATSTIS